MFQYLQRFGLVFGVGIFFVIMTGILQSCATSPCTKGRIGPLAINPNGYHCRNHCECNNQRYHGICLKGRCSVKAKRVACPVQGESLEVHSSNILFDELCPALTKIQIASCPNVTFVKTCGGDGILDGYWSDCFCSVKNCSGGQRVCSSDCRPSKPCICKDLASDVEHCGSCGQACPLGFSCSRGKCLCSSHHQLCPPKTCSGGTCKKICADLQNDSLHCGRCGNACSKGTLCVQGRCQEQLLQSGSYIRGTPFREVKWSDNDHRNKIPKERETPHLVTLTRPFYLGRFEVTQGWFKQVMGYLPTIRLPCKGDVLDCPVHNITVFQAMDFCNKLSQKSRFPGCYTCEKSGSTGVFCKVLAKYSGKNIYKCAGYRLPTDAEWEFAARAGNPHIFPGGSPKHLPIRPENPYSRELSPYAWTWNNAKGSLYRVGSRKPNAYGLFDLRGHVAEWVWGGETVFLTSSRTDPAQESTKHATVRGGDIHSSSLLLRAGSRQLFPLDFRLKRPYSSSTAIGFRIARTAPYSQVCSKKGLSFCDISGCVNTRIDTKHCGQCQRACSDFLECKDGRCVSPEVLVQTKDGQGNPQVWVMGFNAPHREGVCVRKDTVEHKVQFSHDFYAWSYEVQQSEFFLALGFNPSHWVCPRCPVESVTWYQTLAYANAISKALGFESCYECSGDAREVESFSCKLKKKFRGNQGRDYYRCPGYRLPTEAEWEYMAREGGQGKTYCEKTLSNPPGMPWLASHRYNPYFKDSRHILPVPTAKANGLGLYDMFWHVQEWTWDIYYEDYAPSEEVKLVVTDPVGPVMTMPGARFCQRCPHLRDVNNQKCLPCYRSLRGGFYGPSPDGGSLDEAFRYKRHVTRLKNDPNRPRVFPRMIGFRVVRTALPPKGSVP